MWGEGLLRIDGVHLHTKVPCDSFRVRNEHVGGGCRSWVMRTGCVEAEAWTVLLIQPGFLRMEGVHLHNKVQG